MKKKNIFISYSSKSDESIRSTLVDVLRDRFNCEIFSGTPASGFKIESELENSLSKCDLIIAILDKPTPNVFFEAGIAQGMGKNVFLIANGIENIPSNLTHHKCFFWNTYQKEKILIEIEKILVYELGNDRETNESEKKFDKSLRYVDWEEFEKIIFEIFRHYGWEPKINVSQSSTYDIYLNNYYNNKAIVECKKYDTNKKVSLETVLELLENMDFNKIDQGIIVTNSKFTESAIQFVSKLENKKIDLWDIEKIRNEISHTYFSNWEKIYEEKNKLYESVNFRMEENRKRLNEIFEAKSIRLKDKLKRTQETLSMLKKQRDDRVKKSKYSRQGFIKAKFSDLISDDEETLKSIIEEIEKLNAKLQEIQHKLDDKN